MRTMCYLLTGIISTINWLIDWLIGVSRKLQKYFSFIVGVYTRTPTLSKHDTRVIIRTPTPWKGCHSNSGDFQSVRFARTWRQLVQKRTARTRLAIHVLRSDCLDLCVKTTCIVICCIMKRKFKQRWSTIHQISTSTSNLKSARGAFLN
jgi:hypothetical protein